MTGLRTISTRPNYAANNVRLSGATESYLDIDDLLQYMRANVPNIGATETALIESLAFAAEKALENVLGIAIQETTFQAQYDYCNTEYFRLPRTPVTDVTAVASYETNVSDNVPITDFKFAPFVDPVVFVSNAIGKRIAITYESGWTIVNIPVEITEAIRQYTNVLYQAKANNQPAQSIITFIGLLPIQVRNLVMQYKNYSV